MRWSAFASRRVGLGEGTGSVITVITIWMTAKSMLAKWVSGYEVRLLSTKTENCILCGPDNGNTLSDYLGRWQRNGYTMCQKQEDSWCHLWCHLHCDFHCAPPTPSLGPQHLHLHHAGGERLWRRAPRLPVLWPSCGGGAVHAHGCGEWLRQLALSTNSPSHCKLFPAVGPSLYPMPRTHHTIRSSMNVTWRHFLPSFHLLLEDLFRPAAWRPPPHLFTPALPSPPSPLVFPSLPRFFDSKPVGAV